MLVLDDFGEDNACMCVVRGSHKLGLLDHNTTDEGFFNAEPSLARRELWEDDVSLARLTPRAGGLSIHSALTLHGSPANASAKPRRGLVFQYRAADAYQLADNLWDDGGLVVRVKGPSARTCCHCLVFSFSRFLQPFVPMSMDRFWHRCGAARARACGASRVCSCCRGTLAER
jgi:hypothetical protein